ncbi:MAG: ABC transporter permease, partial [Actinobacteria bacterium]|nr:ABC transporter permease [Actinomycetota bacterium]
MGSVWLNLRAGLRGGWRAWLALALLLGVMGGIALGAAAGAWRTETAYPRLLRWAHASDLQLLYVGSGQNAGSYGQVSAQRRQARYYRALGRLPQVAGLSRAALLQVYAPHVLSQNTQVYASADGGLGTSVDRVKILAGHRPDPADASAAVINPMLADVEHARVGGTVTLLGVPDRHGNPDLAHAFPLRFRVAAIGVFDTQVVPAATGDYPTALLTPAFLRARAAGRIPWMPAYGVSAYVRLRPGASEAGFVRSASVLGRRAGGSVSAIVLADEFAATERAIRPYAVAIALFAGLVGLITLILAAQLLSRQLVLDSAEFPVLRALGMPRGRLVALSMARVGAVTVLGGCLAVAIAVAASPLMPIGPARLAEPSPGIGANLAVLAVGLAAIALLPTVMVAPAAWGVASRSRGPESRVDPAAQRRPSRLGAALGRAGSVTGAIGARMAFEPGRGRTAVPVRSALAGIAVAAMAVTAAAVFGSSLLGLVGTPHRYGQDWHEYLDLRFGGIHASLLERVVSAQPGVTGYAIGDFGQVRVNGMAVSGIGLTPVRGEGYLTMLAGRPPARPGEIALGARTLRALQLRVGQTAHVAANGYGEASAPLPMRVVGEAVFPSLGERGSFLGTDLGNGAAVVPSVLSVPNPASGCGPHSGTCYNFAVLRYRPGTSLTAARSRLSATVARTGCPPGSCGVSLDQRPADIRSYAGVRDTPLALGTALA